MFVGGMNQDLLSCSTESYGGSLLLELSASDDVIGFKQAIEEDGSAIDESSSWYGRLTSGKKLGLSQRTPLMIAALYGSKEVIKYILSTYKTCGIDVNWASRTDGATALHCAAAGGSPSSAEIIKLLIDASADVNSLDMSGNRPGDVLCSSSPVLSDSISSLESLLNVSGEGKSPPSAKARSSPEKKEYPVDPSMPDIKNGLYSTDDFRMYTFKVKPCSRAYSHDWTECPFVHPGENARRRDPRRYHYSCVPCPDFRKGACRRGDACEYAHGVFECWLHPAQYRTRLCKDETNCMRRVCFFAHKPEELRSLYPSTGCAIPSPRSSSSPSALDSGLMSPLALNPPSVFLPTTPPMSPTANMGSVWQYPGLANGLQGSRLKSALHARDLIGDDLGDLDEQQLQLLDDLAAVAVASSPPLQQSRLNNLAAASMLAGSAGSWSGKFRSMAGLQMPSTNLDDIFASDIQTDVSSGFDHQSHLSIEAAAAAMAQLQSSTRANMGYGMYLPPVRTSSPQVGMSHGSSSPMMSPALAAAVINSSRSAAFVKRSQSFVDRSAPAVNIGSPTSPALSGWSSPMGKLDWGVHGEELNKLRKSASFGVGSSSSNTGFGGGNNSNNNSNVLVNGEHGADGHRNGFLAEKQMQEYGGGGGGGGLESSSGFLPWVDQLYMEQEQMLA